MEKKRKNWIITLAVLAVFVMGITVAFAAINSELNITGTGKVNSSTFKVIMDSESLFGPIITGSGVEEDGTVLISDYKLEGINASFSNPNSSLSYTFDVKNEGDWAAKIGALTMKTPACTVEDEENEDDQAVAEEVCDNFDYTLTYTTGGATVQEGDKLAKGATVNMTLMLSYGAEGLINVDVEIEDLDITLVYVQDL